MSLDTIKVKRLTSISFHSGSNECESIRCMSNCFLLRALDMTHLNVSFSSSRRHMLHQTQTLFNTYLHQQIHLQKYILRARDNFDTIVGIVRSDDPWFMMLDKNLEIKVMLLNESLMLGGGWRFQWCSSFQWSLLCENTSLFSPSPYYS